MENFNFSRTSSWRKYTTRSGEWSKFKWSIKSTIQYELLFYEMNKANRSVQWTKTVLIDSRNSSGQERVILFTNLIHGLTGMPMKIRNWLWTGFMILGVRWKATLAITNSSYFCNLYNQDWSTYFELCKFRMCIIVIFLFRWRQSLNSKFLVNYLNFFIIKVYIMILNKGKT